MAIILAFKIAVTALLASIPLLLLPAASVQALFKISADAMPLARLYGVAITALLVGYASGFAPAAAGIFPWGVVAMGIFSNAGATLTLLITGAWRRSVASPFIFGAVTLALLWAALFPSMALTHAF